MDMIPIEIKITLDYESYRKFARFMLFRGKGYKVGPVIAFILLPIVTIAALAWNIMTGDLFIFIMYMILFTVFVLLLYLYFFAPKRAYKKSELLHAGDTVHKFYEDHIEITAEGEHIKGTDTVQYTIFKKVYEIDSAFYLMMLNGMTLIISKKYLNAEQTEALSRLFQKRFSDKYKNCH